MPNNSPTDQNRSHAIQQKDRERERGEPILTAMDLPRLLIHSDWDRPRAASTIRQLADALDHARHRNHEYSDGCSACTAGDDLLRRFREGS